MAVAPQVARERIDTAAVFARCDGRGRRESPQRLIRREVVQRRTQTEGQHAQRQCDARIDIAEAQDGDGWMHRYLTAHTPSAGGPLAR